MLLRPQALSVTDSLDEAADLLMKSKTNVRMVVSKLEVDLGRHLDLPTVPGPTAADEGKLLLVRLPKRSRSQLTGVGARTPPNAARSLGWYHCEEFAQHRDVHDVGGVSRATVLRLNRLAWDKYRVAMLRLPLRRNTPGVTSGFAVKGADGCCLCGQASC